MGEVYLAEDTRLHRRVALKMPRPRRTHTASRGSQAINLTAGSRARNSEPAFSPDGERIAFVSNRAGGGIYVMGRQGDFLRRLTTSASRPSWAPDGNSIVYCINGQDLPLSRIVDAATTSTWRIEGSFGDVMHPKWSPDGSRIAY